MLDLSLLFMRQILMATLFVSIFLGWGALIADRFSLKFSSDYEKLFFFSIFGISVCIIYIAVLSFVGIYNIYMLLFLLVGLIGFKKIKLSIQSLKWPFLIFLILSPLILLTMYPATHWDDISYHLPIAQSIVDNHRLLFNPFIRYPVFPINAEILFVLGLSFNQITAQLVTWICLFLLSLGCFSYLSYLLSKTYGLLAVLLLVSNNIVVVLGTVNYIDLVLTLYIFSSIYAVLKYLEHRENNWIYIIGILLGIASGIKYTALIFCIMIGLLLLFIKKWKHFVFLSITTLIFSLPWMVRNIYYAGNPVWPFMSNIFGYSDLWNAGDYEGQFADFKSNGLEKSLLNLIKIPNYLTQSHEGGFNILIWIGLLFLLLCLSKKMTDWVLLLITLSFTIFWFESVNLVRYYLPIVSVLIILSIKGFAFFIEQLNDSKLKCAVLIGIVLFCAVNMYSPLYNKIHDSKLPPSTKIEIDNYLEGNLPSYKGTINATKLEGRTYGLLNENMYYYGKDKIIGDWFGPARYGPVLESLEKPDILFTRLNELGVSNLLINKTRMSKDNLTSMKLDSRFSKVYEDAYSVVYRLIKQT